MFKLLHAVPHSASQQNDRFSHWTHLFGFSKYFHDFLWVFTVFRSDVRKAKQFSYIESITFILNITFSHTRIILQQKFHHMNINILSESYQMC